MKVYLSIPIIANRSPETGRLMAKVIQEAGHEMTSPWVLADVEVRPPKSLNIFARDKAAVEASDVIVAEVSKPSTGVGMEIMAAHIAKNRIILVAQEGSTMSRMLTDMDAERVSYTDMASLAKGLRERLLA